MIHSVYLKHFYMAARFQSIRKAAKYCNVTQPAVSRSIKVLEEELQVPLFIRTKNSSQLTEYGIQLFEFAEIYNKKSKAIRKQFAKISAIEPKLKIGVNKHYGAIFSPFLKSFMRAYPEIFVEVDFTDGEIVRNGFEVGSYDVAIVINYDPLERASYSLESNARYLLEDRIRLCCARDHPLANCSKISLQKMAEFPFLLPSFYVDPIKEQFEANNLNLKIRGIMNHGNLVASLIVDSDCLGILAERTIASEEADKLIFLDSIPFNREFVVIAKFSEDAKIGSIHGRQVLWKYLEENRKDFF